MGMRALAAGSVALTAGLLAAGAGATVTPVTAPVIRTALTVAAAAARGGATAGGNSHTGAAAVTPVTGTVASVTVTVASVTGTVAVAATDAAGSGLRVREGICTAPTAMRQLAARLSAGIEAGLSGRAGHHAVSAYDTVTKVSCYTGSGRHFDSASVVKAIILAALLRWHQETGRALTSWEKEKARLMITRSDNDAATALWNEVGVGRLQHFLGLAKMHQTQLGEDGYWGLTQITAHDEMLLLELLAMPNAVLTASSRSYQLGLMAKVIAGQRWGTTAGAPAGITAHVKNGWLPDDSGWHINSIGVFTGKDKDYMIAVLTDDNPSERYGIATIERVARPVHEALNAAVRAADSAAGGPQARLAATEALGVTPVPVHWAVLLPAVLRPATRSR